MMFKIEFQTIQIANGLIKDIKGYQLYYFSSSISPMKKNYDGYIVTPSLLLVGYPI
jgi:hypothetical protein